MPQTPDTLAAAAAGDALALARVLVATPSVNPTLEAGGSGELAVARLCARWLEGWGFEVALSEVEPGRANVLARMGGGGRRVLLNGHLDTVGVGGMTIDPFGAEVVDGRLLGRGSCDMKGGIAAILSAAAALASEGWEEGELLVALSADEEHASIGAQALVDAGLSADLCVVCEPTGLAVAPAHKGFAWVDLDFRGVAAHGSRPELGVDAIRHAGVFLAALDRLEAGLTGAPAHPLLGHGSVHAGTIRGGRAPSVYPDVCELVLERRLLPHEPLDQGVREVEALLGELREEGKSIDVRVTSGLTRFGSEVPTDHVLVRGLQAALRGRGFSAAIEPMSAWVDAAIFNGAGIPAVCFGPGSIEQAHTADEWCPVDEIEACARVLEDWVRLVFAGGDASA